MPTSVGAVGANVKRFIIVRRPLNSEMHPERFHFMEIGHVLSQV